MTEAEAGAERRFLTEHEAKSLVAGFGIPVTRETLVRDAGEAAEAARRIGFPVVVKGSGEALTHKTELGLVRIGLADEAAVRATVEEWRARKVEGLTGFLVQEMIAGARELLFGLSQDPQFGPVVAFGMGGVAAEALRDEFFRVCPITKADALDMLDEIRGRAILGKFRGEPEADREALAAILLGLSRIAAERPEVAEIDLNPVVLRRGSPVAVDALVGLR